MRLIVWLVRAIFLLLFVRVVLSLVGAGRRMASQRGRPGRVPERAGGTLVRDPQCGTYIPVSRAIRVGTGPSAHYFCSDGCRTAYLAAHQH
jgi:uncharacterized protein